MSKIEPTNSLPIITDSTGNTFIRFNLDKSNLLYHYDGDFPYEFIEEYLSYDRDKAIEDLENIIIHSCIINKKRVASSFAPLHALFLLGELESEESLPVILHMLRQNEKYIDNIIGDFITETLWMVIVKVGINQLDVLEKFAMEDDVQIFSRLSVCDAFVQIILHYPDKRDEVLQIFDRILKSISSASKHYERFDPSFNAFIISNIIDLGLVDYLPTIKEMDSNGLIDRRIVGNFEDIEDELTKDRPISARKRQIMNMKDMYKHYFAMFGASAFDLIDKKLSYELNQHGSSTRENKKINRNDPCPCGSGKKFKKCCAGNGMYD